MLAALARGDVAVEKLKAAQKAKGVDVAVDQYVDKKQPHRLEMIRY